MGKRGVYVIIGLFLVMLLVLGTGSETFCKHVAYFIATIVIAVAGSCSL